MRHNPYKIVKMFEETMADYCGSKYAVSIAVGVFIGGSISHAILLRSISQGLEWTLFVMIVTFSMDTGAFIIGKAIGNKPFAITKLVKP